MSCENCYNGCGTVTSDECVKYTGETVESLGIVNGDPLSKVEDIILTKIQEYAQGEGIMLDCVEIKCSFIKGLLGCCKDKSLCNMIQVLVDASCSLKQSFDTLSTQINPAFAFTLSCLAGSLPANPTRDQIIQAIITKLCDVSAKVDVIYADYVKASQLNSLITSYLSGAGSSAQQYTKMVPYVAYEYYGPLSNFNGAGQGLAAFGFDKVYLCVGQTIAGFTLPDKRGRVAVGVPSMPGGPALDSAVDYNLPQNTGTNYVLKQKVGSSFVTLSVNQMPVHTHTATTAVPNHSHKTVSVSDSGAPVSSATAISQSHSTGGNLGYSLTGGSTIATVGQTSAAGAATLDVTVLTEGNSQQHENRQPSIAAFYIMYIP